MSLKEDELLALILKCKHENIDEEGNCCNCQTNFEINKFSENNDIEMSFANKDKTRAAKFLDELNLVQSIPSEITDWIKNKLYMIPKTICRKDRRRQIIFSYIILAYHYIYNEYEINNKELSNDILMYHPLITYEEMNLSLKDGREALNLVGAISSKLLPQNEADAITLRCIISKPVVFLPILLCNITNKYNEFEHLYNELYNFITDVTNIDIQILDHNPRVVCIGLMKIFFANKAKKEKNHNLLNKYTFISKKIHTIYHITSLQPHLKEYEEYINYNYNIYLKKINSKNKFKYNKKK